MSSFIVHRQSFSSFFEEIPPVVTVGVASISPPHGAARVVDLTHD